MYIYFRVSRNASISSLLRRLFWKNHFMIYISFYFYCFIFETILFYILISFPSPCVFPDFSPFHLLPCLRECEAFCGESSNLSHHLEKHQSPPLCIYSEQVSLHSEWISRSQFMCQGQFGRK